MKQKFKSRKVTVAGIQESGKTQWVKHVVRTQFKRPIVYSLNKHDWVKENVFLFVPQDYKAEIDGFLAMVKKQNGGKNKSFDAVIFDDFDLAFDGVGSNSLSPILNNLNAMHRHPPWKIACFFVTRRPQDIPTKIAESSHFNVVFPVEGDNVKKKYKSIDERIWKLVENLRYKDYRYVIKAIGEAPVINSPIPYKK